VKQAAARSTLSKTNTHLYHIAGKPGLSRYIRAQKKVHLENIVPGPGISVKQEITICKGL
jgi:hypothetical protein